MYNRTEDQVRDGYAAADKFINGARQILGFDKPEKDVLQGTGQITTFNELGFPGVLDRPDGWYLPKSPTDVAIILETKAEDEAISKQKYIDELMKNIRIAQKKYKNVIGILYNGQDVAVYKNEELLKNCGGGELQNKTFYLSIFNQVGVDKELVYSLTKRINDNLHINFGVKNLNHRMIFTACALVAKRYGAMLTKGMDYNLFTTSILSTLNKSLQAHRNQNQKLDILVEVYGEVRMNYQENQQAIDDFVECVCKISDSINSNKLNRNDINFEKQECVVLGKGDKERIVYFDARAKVHLQNYLNSREDNNPALFVSLLKPHNRLEVPGVEVCLRKLGRRLDMDKIHPHKFRRTLATKAIDKGMPVEQLQTLLGHSQINTTMEYAIVNQTNVKSSHKKYIA